MLCPKCGKEIFDEALFCPNCGCAVKNDSEKSSNAEVETATQKTKKSVGEKIFLIAAPVFVLCFFVAVIFIANGYDKRTTSEGSNKSGTNYTATTTTARHTVSNVVLEQTVSDCRYSVGPFSITVYDLVSRAMDGYKLEFLRGDEISRAGYLSREEMGGDEEADNWYCGVISGNVMANPELTYLTNYYDDAVVVLMHFDEYDNLLNCSLKLCSDLQTCAILITTG